MKQDQNRFTIVDRDGYQIKIVDKGFLILKETNKRSFRTEVLYIRGIKSEPQY